MVIEQFSGLIDLIQINSYFIIFLLIVIEGPIVTAIASYAASLGYLNIWIVIIISAIGKILPDIILYLIGRFSRNLKIDFLKKRFKLKDFQIEKIEENLKKHSGKTICLVKLCPMLPIPGLILSGFIKISFKKFLFINIVFNLISTLIFALLGYYFGYAIDSIFKYFKIGEYSLLGLILLVIIIYIVLKKFKLKKLFINE